MSRTTAGRLETSTATADPGPAGRSTLPVHGDNRGWFKENWQRDEDDGARAARLRAGAEQHLLQRRGAAPPAASTPSPGTSSSRVATGRIFGAWVDLRAGRDLRRGRSPSRSTRRRRVFVPRGVGQRATRPWSPTPPTPTWSTTTGARGQGPTRSSTSPTRPLAIAVADPAGRGRASREKDRAHPRLADVVPMAPATDADRRARAASWAGRWPRRSPTPWLATRTELDLADPAAVAALDCAPYGVMCNAAALHRGRRRRDRRGAARRLGGERRRGRPRWRRPRRGTGSTLVHVSTDYVFDGTVERAHRGRAVLARSASTARPRPPATLWSRPLPRHYILRTSWVIGDGNNFVRTMALAGRPRRRAGGGRRPVGRLTFTARARRGRSRTCSATGAPYGTYNLTNGGRPHDLGRHRRGPCSPARRPGPSVSGGVDGRVRRRQEVAPRPQHSTLDLAKLTAAGFTARDQLAALETYLAG